MIRRALAALAPGEGHTDLGTGRVLCHLYPVDPLVQFAEKGSGRCLDLGHDDVDARLVVAGPKMTETLGEAAGQGLVCLSVPGEESCQFGFCGRPQRPAIR